jgi:hypothetical protein
LNLTCRVRDAVLDPKETCCWFEGDFPHRRHAEAQGWWQDAAIRRLLIWPPFGAVASHDLLRRTSSISRLYGADRGTAIDRCYVEDFLARHANDIRGVVLEIQDDAYTKRFGKSTR